MRRYLRLSLATLAAGAVGAAMLIQLSHVANTQPAAAAAAPHGLGAIAVPRKPPPTHCPMANTASQVEPDSCNPQPPPPPPINCQLSIGDPVQVIQEHRIYVNGGISCTGGNPISIILTVELYNIESHVPVDRTQITRVGGRTAAAVARYNCHTGGWYGKVRASVQKTLTTTDHYGPLGGGIVYISCVV